MSKKVLIIDDKEENQLVLKNFFNFFGPNKSQIELFFADNSKTAYEIVEKEVPDLIFLDIFIETRTSGLELAEKIKEKHKNISIWALTATAMKASEFEESDEEKCIKSGCDKYFSKPFDQKNMVVEVSNCLDVPVPDYIKKRLGLE